MLPRSRFLIVAALLFVFGLCLCGYSQCPPGDFNQDCRVDARDLQVLAWRWLDPHCPGPNCPDLDGADGINFVDFTLLASNWLKEGSSLTLVINEFMAKNNNSIEDEDGDNDDWIEIYNYGDQPIDMAGMYLTDSLSTDPAQWWQIPATDPPKTTVPPGGYLLIWADNETDEGILHAAFKLDADGEQIRLFDTHRNLVDSVTFGPQQADESFGRYPDGTDSWLTFKNPTPQAPNQKEPVAVVINEIMYHPYSESLQAEDLREEYIELYNASSEPVDLNDWRFTNGIEFVFPPVILEPNHYLVIASDVNAFSAKYPTVTNVIGNFSGRLNNSGEAIELVDKLGARIDRVRYADEGDWAVRELGPVDHLHRGWIWRDDHDGGRKSLELINPAMPNEFGQNWAASEIDDGTPGAPNTKFKQDIAPLIVELKHTPIIPGPNDTVTIRARILDESTTGLTVTLFYRPDSSEYTDRDLYPHFDPNDYTTVPMFDDGAHNDEAAGDGIYGAQIPPHPHGTIIEFFIQASDTSGNTRSYPAPSLIDGQPKQVTNALYQVDETFGALVSNWSAGDQPIYYLIMTNAEKDRLLDIGDREGNEYNSDAQMNTTFISFDGNQLLFRYNCGVRNRGHGSRDEPPNNYRVNFPHDRPWKGVTAINLNTKYTYLQLVGSALFQLAGLPIHKATAVQVRLNGQNYAVSGREMYGSYVHLEVIDSDFTERQFPDDPDGNIYKCMRVTHQADLRYEGPDPDPYRYNYFKQTNTAVDDWSDLIELTYVLNNSPDELYAQEVNRIVNIEQWLRFFAVNTILDNSETTLASGNGDDYYLYCGIEDRRFVLIQHDLDSIFGIGDNPGSATRGIFRATGTAAIKRFLEHPQFVRRYYYHLQDLLQGVFAEQDLRPLLEQLIGDFVPETTINQMMNFIAQRKAHILSLIPSQLTIQCDLPQADGYYLTNTNIVQLSGTADAVGTRSVLVNGQLAQWSALDAQWSTDRTTNTPTETLIARGSRWKYFDRYTDLGPNWYQSIDDANWPEGSAELGYGDGPEGRPEATTIGYIDTNPTTPTIEKNITTYFTHHFQVADPSRYTALILRVLRDDGVVIYLNGTEIARSNMPAGSIDYNSLASSNVFGTQAETTFYGGAVFAGDDDFTNIDPALLHAGTNVIAVELHQFSPTSADISFDLELLGQLEPPSQVDGIVLNPGINRIVVQSFDGPGGTGNELERATIDIWYNDGDLSPISGALSTDTTLTAQLGPWHVTGDIIVGAGVTLTIEPGTTLFFEPGTGITVQAGGRLLAVGSPYQRIRFTRIPGDSSQWDGVKFDHSLEDNRLVCLDHEFGDAQGESTDVQYSRLLLDDVTWAGTNTRILNVDHPTVICRNCVFPSISGTEPIHGVGLTGNEQLIFEGCVFGTSTGYNDIIDFTGGQRPGPIFQLYNNIFLGGGDDGPDLDGTDAHIEGNIFMNFHRGHGGDSTSNAIATGQNGSDTADICVVRNIFIGNDHAILLKEDAYLWAENNTFVDTNIAVISFGEPDRNPPRTPGKGATLLNNIFYNNAAMFENFFQDPHPEYGPAEVIAHNCILPAAWHHLGQNNIDADPLFVDPISDLRLMPDSPAIAAGLWGLDLGAFVPEGATISGVPGPVTYKTQLTLTVGGPGITHYKYTLNDPNGPWSKEYPVEEPIVLADLQPGQSYTVYVIGKNSAGRWQSQEKPTASQSWTVEPTYARLVINEVLASNTSANDGTSGDLIELYYDGPSELSLAGMSITNSPGQRDKFVFPPGLTIQPGQYLVLYADANTTAAGIHLGFALDGDGEGVYLYDKAGTLIDCVEFGLQIPDLSIGRVGYEGKWRLTIPTFGQPNKAHPLGNPYLLKINEWLAKGQVLFEDDFVELYNPSPFPVDLSNLYLTDNPITQPMKDRLGPLSFIPANGYVVLQADEQDRPGHLNFRLSADGELLALLDSQANQIDKIFFGPQLTDLSQGRTPDGGPTVQFLQLPTPGIANTTGPNTTTTTSIILAEDADKRAIVPTSTNQVDPNWLSDPDFDDSTWILCSGAPGGIGYERHSGYESLITLDVETDMYGRNTTCYVRAVFTLSPEDLSNLTELVLKVRYDDGFVAYLNGVEVARRNFTGTGQWNSRADGNHEAIATDFDEVLDISTFIPQLRVGKNLLAVQALNTSSTSSDFLISVKLETTATVVEPGQFPYENELALLNGLRITELMYHAPEGPNYDYIELTNIADTPLDLNGVRVSDAVDFTFGPTVLEPNQSVVLVANLAAFRLAYGPGPHVAGEYLGSLSNTGEQIILKLPAPLEAAILRFTYSDSWYSSTDGGGQALTIRDPYTHPADWAEAASWQPATPTPGQL